MKNFSLGLGLLGLIGFLTLFSNGPSVWIDRNRSQDPRLKNRSIDFQERQHISSVIFKSVIVGVLTGAASRIADLRIFPFVGFLTEPSIRRFLLEELFREDPAFCRQAEIAIWFSWISSWFVWCYIH